MSSGGRAEAVPDTLVTRALTVDPMSKEVLKVASTVHAMPAGCEESVYAGGVKAFTRQLDPSMGTPRKGRVYILEWRCPAGMLVRVWVGGTF